MMLPCVQVKQLFYFPVSYLIHSSRPTVSDTARRNPVVSLTEFRMNRLGKDHWKWTYFDRDIGTYMGRRFTIRMLITIIRFFDFRGIANIFFIKKWNYCYKKYHLFISKVQKFIYWYQKFIYWYQKFIYWYQKIK